MVRQKLSDEITQLEIADYYEKNKSLFVLDKPLVKGLFIKVPLQSTGLADVRRWYKKNAQDAIEKFCLAERKNNHFCLFRNCLGLLLIHNPQQRAQPLGDLVISAEHVSLM